MESITKPTLTSEQQRYIKRWSIAGFFGPWIMALGNKMYLVGTLFLLLTLLWSSYFMINNYYPWRHFEYDVYWRIPYWIENIIDHLFYFVLLPLLFGFKTYMMFKGRERGWEGSSWKSFEAYRKRQQDIGPIVVLYCVIFSLALLIISISGFGAYF